MKLLYCIVFVLTANLYGQDGIVMNGLVGRSTYKTVIPLSAIHVGKDWKSETEEPPISIGYAITKTTKLILAYGTKEQPFHIESVELIIHPDFQPVGHTHIPYYKVIWSRAKTNSPTIDLRLEKDFLVFAVLMDGTIYSPKKQFPNQ